MGASGIDGLIEEWLEDLHREREVRQALRRRPPICRGPTHQRVGRQCADQGTRSRSHCVELSPQHR
jgi:hypothetical protein